MIHYLTKLLYQSLVTVDKSHWSHSVDRQPFKRLLCSTEELASLTTHQSHGGGLDEEGEGLGRAPVTDRTFSSRAEGGVFAELLLSVHPQYDMFWVPKSHDLEKDPTANDGPTRGSVQSGCVLLEDVAGRLSQNQAEQGHPLSGSSVQKRTESL